MPTQSSASLTDRCCIGRPSRRCRRSREIENTEVVGTSRPPRPAVQIPITTSASCFPISACNRAIPSTPSGSRPCSASVRPGPSARDHDDPRVQTSPTNSNISGASRCVLIRHSLPSACGRTVSNLCGSASVALTFHQRFRSARRTGRARSFSRTPSPAGRALTYPPLPVTSLPHGQTARACLPIV